MEIINLIFCCVKHNIHKGRSRQKLLLISSETLREHTNKSISPINSISLAINEKLGRLSFNTQFRSSTFASSFASSSAMSPREFSVRASGIVTSAVVSHHRQQCYSKAAYKKQNKIFFCVRKLNFNFISFWRCFSITLSMRPFSLHVDVVSNQIPSAQGIQRPKIICIICECDYCLHSSRKTSWAYIFCLLIVFFSLVFSSFALFFFFCAALTEDCGFALLLLTMDKYYHYVCTIYAQENRNSIPRVFISFWAHITHSPLWVSQ